jgi:hypothetical protein
MNLRGLDIWSLANRKGDQEQERGQLALESLIHYCNVRTHSGSRVREQNG